MLELAESSHSSSRDGASSRLQTEAALRVVRDSPWAWGGVTDLVFHADGSLDTPWGKGTWGGLPGTDEHVFADFVGSIQLLRDHCEAAVRLK